MCRLTAAHKTIRLMLLGPPPDMVHGALLHRTRTPIFRNGSDSRAFVQLHTLRRDNFYYTTQQTEFQVFLQKNFIFTENGTFFYSFYTEGKIIDEEDAYYLENSFSDFGSIGMCYYGVILLSGQGE